MPTRPTKQMLLWTLLVLIVAGAVGFIFLLTVPAPIERWLQARILLALREHYQADVQLQNLRVTLIPEFDATADNFILPDRRYGNLPPLISVKHFAVKAGVLQLLRSPIHLSWLKLDGMVIQV